MDARRHPSSLATFSVKALGLGVAPTSRMKERARACDLLRQGWRCEEVADALGYSSGSTFTRAFRRAHGMTPTAWRDEFAESLDGARQLGSDRVLQPRRMHVRVLEALLLALDLDTDEITSFLAGQDVAQGAALPWLQVQPFGFPDAIGALVGETEWGVRAALGLAERITPLLAEAPEGADPHEFLRALQRVMFTYNGDFSWGISVGPDVTAVSLESPAVPHPQSGDIYMVLLFRALARFLPAGIQGHTLYLMRRPPTDPKHHTRVFGCEVVYGAERNALEVPSSLLRPLVSTSSLPHRVEPRINQIERAYIEAVRGGCREIEEIARRMGLATRTLQRHLQEHGTSHRTLRDRAASQIAASLLLATDVRVSDVASRLAFSSVGAFCRAFRRWSGGRAPGLFRLQAPVGRAD